MRKILGIVLLLLVAVAIWSDFEHHDGKAATLSVNRASSGPENNGPSNPGEKNSEDATWHYLTTSDSLTDQPIKGALIFSTNKANFTWPYDGGSNLSLAFRRRGGHTDAMIVISKGQFMCEIDGCALGFRFDDGPVESIRAVPSGAGKSDVVFVQNALPLLRRLQRVHHLRIAATFYDNGRSTFDFDTDGLDIHQLD